MRECKSVIVIPVLNPDNNLITYIEELIRNGVQKIIVVDDGSDETYKDIFSLIEKIPQCILYTHDVNMGKGKALKDALKVYQNERLYEKFDGIITVDADGQHSVVDVLKISEAMNTTDDQLILGERKFDKDVPLRSRFGNSCTRVIFRLLYGMKVEDTQTGLRGIPNKLILQFDDLEGERYEYEMNMLIICSIKKIKIKSINIQTIYLDDNSSSHFNAVKDSFRIYRLLFKNFFKFVVSSLSSSLIDIILFQMLVIFLKEKSSRYILLSTIGARVFSSIYNFTLNKKIVFNSNNKLGHTIIKYYLLCLIQMLISAGFVTGIYIIVPINETIIKIVVDTILFFISYRIQKSWIFSKK